MANYKVGDLDVTISGVSKDAVSSLDEVIKQLDTLQGKLGIVGKGFSGAFKVNNAAIRAVVGDFDDIERVTKNATDSQEKLNATIENGIVRAGQSFGVFGKEVGELQDKINSATKYLMRYQRDLAEAISNNDVEGIEAATTAINKEREAIANAKDKLAQLTNQMSLMGEMSVIAADSTEEFKEEIKNGTKQAQDFEYELNQTSKELKATDKAANRTAKGGLPKLIKQIGRIALYRTIRRGLQLITQTFKESIQAYAQVDDNINKMMSQLTSSTKVISLSLGTIIFPILQAATPIVQQLSVGFANMANAINKSMALAQGNATYTKINTDALKDYRKELNKTSGALFDFDKFRALSNKQDTASIFLSTEDVSALDKAESKYSGIYTLVSGIGDILGQALKLVGQIFDAASPIIDVVFKIAGWLLKGVGYVLDFLNNIGLIKPILYGILTVLGIISATKIITFITNGSLVSGIKAIGTAIKNVNKTTLAWGAALAAVTAAFYILSNWDEFNRGTKIAITVISGLATALLAAATAAMALHGTLTLGTAIPLITAAVASGVVFVRGLVDIPNYATGASDIDSGTVFRAGEAGKTEAVFTGDNGKTNVANVQQMYQAEYMAVLQALKDYGAARGEMPQLQPASDTGIYQAAERGARKAGRKFANV